VAYLIFIFISIALLSGFFVLTECETKRGVRFLAPQRTRLDEIVDRVMFVVTHVDFNSFVRDITRRLVHYMAHEVAHFSLLVVRAVERFLTRIVQHLRAKRAVDAPAREPAREFVQTLSDFKDQLKATPPDVPDVLS